MGVAFKPEELKEVKKEFRGVIVKAEIVESAKFKPGRKQLHVLIQTDAYELPQHEWYPPSDKKLTKWGYFIGALAECGALADIEIKGVTDEEKLESLCKALVGMEFLWIEMAGLPTIAGKEVEILLPVEYYGRKKIAPPVEEREVAFE